MKALIFRLTICVVMLWSFEVRSQWGTDGVELSNGGGYPAITQDGFGGALVAWSAYNADLFGYEVWVQRLDAIGYKPWINSPDGVVLAGGGFLGGTVAAPDGLGGVFVAWQVLGPGDFFDIYASRVNKNGIMATPYGGKPVCTAADHQTELRIISDGAAVPGAIIVWSDSRSGAVDEDGDSDIYVQRINSTCDPQWGTNGKVICAWPNDQRTPQITTDGQGGAIVAWVDERGFDDLRVQRVNASGDTLWSPSVTLCSAPYAQYFTPWYHGVIAGSCIVSDGQNGAIIVWVDQRDLINFPQGEDLYAARVGPTGDMLWAANGVPVCAAPGNQGGVSIAPVSAKHGGGAVVVWDDHRETDGDPGIYLQRLKLDGSHAWVNDGIRLDAAFNDIAEYNYPTIATDGAGGAIVAWKQYDLGLARDRPYAQRVSHGGMSVWNSGAPVEVGLGYANDPQPIVVPSDLGSAIVAWADGSVYANRVPTPSVTWVGSTPSAGHLQMRATVPNPFSSGTRFEVRAATDGPIAVDIFDVAGKRVRSLQLTSTKAHWTVFAFDGRDSSGKLLPSGVYLCRVSARGESATQKMVILR